MIPMTAIVAGAATSDQLKVEFKWGAFLQNVAYGDAARDRVVEYLSHQDGSLTSVPAAGSGSPKKVRSRICRKPKLYKAFSCLYRGWLALRRPGWVLIHLMKTE